MKVSELVSQYNEKVAKAEEDAKAAKNYALELRTTAKNLRQQATLLEAEADDVARESRDAIREVSWVEEIVRPLAASIASKKGKKANVLGPRGIGAKVNIVLHNCDDPTNCWEWTGNETLTVEPHFRAEGDMTLLYETGEREERYPAGSLGAVNGLNNVTAELPDGEDDIAALFRGEKSWKEMEEEVK